MIWYVLIFVVAFLLGFFIGRIRKAKDAIGDIYVLRDDEGVYLQLGVADIRDITSKSQVLLNVVERIPRK
ncbi:MAG: hypothetical protein MJZ20_01420 [Bacteroidaceae bacterium]|nr:hypothetical protein [Bacteroidaceae bacterium]